MAIDSTGDFVVAWVSDYQYDSSPALIDEKNGIFAQRFFANGTPNGAEFHVNTYTTGDQNQVSVAMDSSGAFVIVWASNGQDGDGEGIYGQRFDSTGAASGGEFQINTFTVGDQADPAVAMDGSANFVVTWTSQNQVSGTSGADIYARSFDSSGVAAATEFLVNTTTTLDESAPAIAMEPGGDYVITWQGYSLDDGDGIFAQQYKGGTTSGGEFLVNDLDSVGAPQSQPAVAMDAAGNFVVAFRGNGGGGNDIEFRRFDSNGLALDATNQLVNQANNEPDAPSIAIDSEGNFSIAWTYTTGSKVSFGREFNAAGLALGTEFQINPDTGGDEFGPAVAAAGPNQWVFTWTSSILDGDNYGVYAKRYQQSLPPNWPFDTETPINSFTTSNQRFASVASDSQGDVVVTWASLGEDGSGYGIYAQLYNFDGEPQSGPFRVNTFTTGDQSHPSVAMDSTGDFVITWMSAGQDGDGQGIYARRYSNAGVALGTEFLVNTTTTGDQSLPVVAMGSTGAFVVAWQSVDDINNNSQGIFAQRFDVAGSPQDSEFQVNVFTTDQQSHPAIAMDSGSHFVIAWQSENQDSDSFGIYGRLYDGSGTPQTGDFQVNTYTTGSQQDAKVGMDSNGNFVVVWTSYGQDLNQTIRAQRFDSTGAPKGLELRIDSSTTDSSRTPSVAMNSNGGFAVTWVTDDRDGNGTGIFGRFFSDKGATRGSEFQVNEFTIGNQFEVAVAGDSIGNIGIVWSSNTQDGDGLGIYGKRIHRPADVPLSGGVAQQVNTFTPGNQINPAVAMDADGEYVITWYSYNQSGEIGTGIYAQRYNASGVAVGGEIHVNTFTTGNQFLPTVAMDHDHGFVIVWNTSGQSGTPDTAGIYARRFDNNGNALDTHEFLINATTANTQSQPAIAMDSHGDYVVAWRSLNQDGSGYGIYGRQYSFANGSTTTSSEFSVNTFTTGNQTTPSVAIADNGDFVIVWSSANQVGATSQADIFARRYDHTGGSLDTEFLVNEFTTGNQQNPAIAMTQNGQFIIAWESAGQDDVLVPTGLGIFGRIYDNGTVPTPVGGEFLINSTVTSDQQAPSVGASSNGFIAAWTSLNEDGELNGIFAQRYDILGGTIGLEFQVNTYTTLSQHQATVAMDPTGDFVVAWHSGGQDGSNYGVFERRFIGITGPGAAPIVTDAHFVYQNKPQRIEIFFDRDVSASLNDGDLSLLNTTFGFSIGDGSQDGGANVPHFTWRAVANEVIFTFPGQHYNGALPSGRYTATLSGTGVFDSSGEQMGSDFSFNFFWLNADINHDGSVDLSDAYLLESHWFQPSNFNYLAGDLNYDGTVNASDLTILAHNWYTIPGLTPDDPNVVVSIDTLDPSGPAPAPPLPQSQEDNSQNALDQQTGTSSESGPAVSTSTTDQSASAAVVSDPLPPANVVIDQTPPLEMPLPPKDDVTTEPETSVSVVAVEKQSPPPKSVVSAVPAQVANPAPIVAPKIETSVPTVIAPLPAAVIAPIVPAPVVKNVSSKPVKTVQHKPVKVKAVTKPVAKPVAHHKPAKAAVAKSKPKQITVMKAPPEPDKLEQGAITQSPSRRQTSKFSNNLIKLLDL
ncbi:MAG TPA: dockerin type I domain-containing protein [Tepidisphaeraceae bacterium]|nr:dockerin type I domain-containing protein [Tepidisphaeraceae bacterium]